MKFVIVRDFSEATKQSSPLRRAWKTYYGASRRRLHRTRKIPGTPMLYAKQQRRAGDKARRKLGKHYNIVKQPGSYRSKIHGDINLAAQMTRASIGHVPKTKSRRDLYTTKASRALIKKVKVARKIYHPFPKLGK